MKLAIIDIVGTPYDGSTVFKQGLGGSESAVVLISRELQSLGFNVTVFNNCDIDHASPGIYDDVTYRPLTDLNQSYEFDVVISSRTVIPFVDSQDLLKLIDSRAFQFVKYDIYNNVVRNAKVRALWMHDTFSLGDNMLEELAISNRITDIFTLSDFHLTYVANCTHGNRRNFEVLKQKMFITRNGATKYNVPVDITTKDKNLFVYNASVSKGMNTLVKDIWPLVKQNIPTAKLKVLGGFYKFQSNSLPDQQEEEWRTISSDIQNQQLDIEFTGIISQKDVATTLAEANFMIYPATFPETYGISTLEAMLYNVPVITCRFGALEEVAIDNACYKIDYPIEPNILFPHINKQDQITKFVKMVVDAYNDPYLHQQKQYYCNIIKPIVGWDTVALQWKQFLFKKLDQYLPIDQYKQVSEINHRVNKIYSRRYHNTTELSSQLSFTEQPIVVISTFYNSQKYIEKCIDSVATQYYQNYKHILIDDCSTDDTASVAAKKISELPEHLQKKFSLVINSTNVGAVKNQIESIRKLEGDPIVILLDGDDSLINDNTVFCYYNDIYDGNTEFTYGSCKSLVDNIPLISQPYPEKVKQQKEYRKHKFNWGIPYTHLRTFKKHLLDGLDNSLFTDQEGNWFKAGGDGAVFYALIESATPDKVKCLQDIVYNYNDINPLNDYKVNGDEQNRTARYISNKRQVEKYSVIIPTMWRIADQFVNFVHTLCDNESVGEIIIINNDNTKTPEGLQHPKIRMFDHGRNTFVNPAWNFGVTQAVYNRICIANDDIIFDTAVFDKLQSMLLPTNGMFGLHPGIAEYNQIPVTDKTIDIIPWTPGTHLYGFGCLFFFHKESWHPIPAGLDIYYGDNYIFDLQMGLGKQNYIIANIDVSTQFEVTTSDITLTGGVMEREQEIYFSIHANLLNFAKEIKEAALPKAVSNVALVRNKKRILIGIPTAKNIEPETFKSIYDLEVPDGYEITFQYFYGYNIDQVRNLIADWTVKGFDYLFSVDSDISFPPDTLKKLLVHNKDIVSGLYIQRKPGLHILEIYETNSSGGVTNIDYEKIKNDRVVEIVGCGFGCVLIKTEVLRSVGYPQFEYHSAIDHRNTVSEDVDFCIKARRKGFTLWADTSILCNHTGSWTFEVGKK